MSLKYGFNGIPYRTNVWWEKSLAKMSQMSIWRKKFGEPTVYEEAIQGTWILFGEKSLAIYQISPNSPNFSPTKLLSYTVYVAGFAKT